MAGYVCSSTPGLARGSACRQLFRVMAHILHGTQEANLAYSHHVIYTWGTQEASLAYSIHAMHTK